MNDPESPSSIDVYSETPSFGHKNPGRARIFSGISEDAGTINTSNTAEQVAFPNGFAIKVDLSFLK